MRKATITKTIDVPETEVELMDYCESVPDYGNGLYCFCNICC